MKDRYFASGFRLMIEDIFTFIDDASCSLSFDRLRIKNIYELYVNETRNGVIESFANICRKDEDLKVLKMEIMSTYDEYFGEVPELFRDHIKERENDDNYPFIDDYKDYECIIEEVEDFIEYIKSYNTVYTKEIQNIYENDILIGLKHQIYEIIENFENDMKDEQIRLTFSVITSNIDILFAKELEKVECFSGKEQKDYDLEAFHMKGNSIIEDAINDLKKMTTFSSIDVEVNKQGKSYLIQKYWDINSLVYQKCICNINNQPNDSKFIELLAELREGIRYVIKGINIYKTIKTIYDILAERKQIFDEEKNEEGGNESSNDNYESIELNSDFDQMISISSDNEYNDRIEDDQDGYESRMEDDQDGYEFRMEDDQDGYEFRMEDDQDGYESRMEDDQDGYESRMEDDQDGYESRMEDDQDGYESRPRINLEHDMPVMPDSYVNYQVSDDDDYDPRPKNNLKHDIPMMPMTPDCIFHNHVSNDDYDPRPKNNLKHDIPMMPMMPPPNRNEVNPREIMRAYFENLPNYNDRRFQYSMPCQPPKAGECNLL